MNAPIRRAMVLAAGFGSRLGDIGQLRPKPLLPVCDQPLLAWTLRWLKKMGIEEVMINLHHLGEQVVAEIGDGNGFGLRVHYSYETEILGTGGGVRKVAKWLADGSGAPILLLNGKLLHDIDLPSVLDFHRQTQAEATMVVREDQEGIWGASLQLREDGSFSEFLGEADAAAGPGRPVMFCGIHLFSPDFLARIPADEAAPCIVRTAYRQLFREAKASGGLRGYLHRGYWWEHSTPARYLAGIQKVLRSDLHLSRVDGPGPGVDPSVVIEAGADVDPRVHLAAGVVVRAGATIGAGVDLGQNVVVESGATLESCVVWPGLRVAGSYVDVVVSGPDGKGVSRR